MTPGTSGKVFHISFNAMYPKILPVNCFIDILKCHFDKALIRQLHMAVSLRMNTANKSCEKQCLPDVAFRFFHKKIKYNKYIRIKYKTRIKIYFKLLVVETNIKN